MIRIWEGRKRYRDWQNNSNISLVNRYFYSAVDKVANSTIKAILFKIEYKPIWKQGLIEGRSLKDKRLSPLLSPYQVPSWLLEDVLFSDQYRRFCFVRNPYSRLLSCYLDRIKDKRSYPSKEVYKLLGKSVNEDVSFSEFLGLACSQSSTGQNPHWRRQVDDLMWGEITYDFVGKFENLNQDCELLSRFLFGDVLEEFDMLSENFSPSKTNASALLDHWYTSELKGMVYESYRDDFDIFEYQA